MYATFIDMYYYIIALISSKWISNASEFWTLICCYSNKLDIWCGYWKKNKLISSISATNINKPNKINSYFILVGFRSARPSNLTIVRHSHSLFMSTHTSLRTRNFTISQTFATNNKAPIQQPTINIPASRAQWCPRFGTGNSSK